MTAYLVYTKGRKAKCEAQVWRFNSNKALRKRTDIVRQVEITDEEADNFSIKDLENMYGSVYQSDTVEPRTE
jgi:hypothetical protein